MLKFNILSINIIEANSLFDVVVCPFGKGNGQVGCSKFVDVADCFHIDGVCNFDVDVNGNIYVVDRANCRVQKFNNNGQFVSKFGTSGDAQNVFNNVIDITVDNEGYIYLGSVEIDDVKVAK